MKTSSIDKTKRNFELKVTAENKRFKSRAHAQKREKVHTTNAWYRENEKCEDGVWEGVGKEARRVCFKWGPIANEHQLT